MQSADKHDLRKKALALPDDPGVYIMKDKNLNIIYVGKAKNLKNRVSQYFCFSSGHTEKVRSMVENIKDFEYLITNTEYEALVLECNLIKKHLPKYNILLKDDKGYKYIKISSETWPRMSVVNKKDSSKCKYIGPFMSLLKIKNTLDEVNKIFKLPTCKRNFNKRSRPCLNYYIDRCSAPCAGKITLDEYLESIKMACSFLKNGGKEELKKLRKDMLEASDNLEFEKAARIRDKIKLIESVGERQKIILNKNINCDFIAFTNDQDEISMNILKFREGVLSEYKSFIFDINSNIDETKLELIEGYYIVSETFPDKIFIDAKINGLDTLQTWLSEKIGEKLVIGLPGTRQDLEIMKMCKKNSYEGLVRAKDGINRNIKVLLDLKGILGLENTPNYIEAYDISNMKDTQKVGGLVVFKNGNPLKSAYKKFKIKSVTGQDDYASIIEVIKRRFDRYLKEPDNSKFNTTPDLILIDGGTGHTRKVIRCMREIGLSNIPVFGMVKDNRHRTRAITDGINEINIKNTENIFNFITRIQDEVHRFTINYHRKSRSLELKSSQLEQIPGISKKRSQILLKRFKSIDRLSRASVEEIMTIPGIPLPIASSIVEYFKNRDKN